MKGKSTIMSERMTLKIAIRNAVNYNKERGRLQFNKAYQDSGIGTLIEPH